MIVFYQYNHRGKHQHRYSNIQSTIILTLIFVFCNNFALLYYIRLDIALERLKPQLRGIIWGERAKIVAKDIVKKGGVSLPK